MYFPTAFFDISVHFTTHLIKKIKLLGPVFLHQMYVYERFNGILKAFIRNQDYRMGTMVQGYCIEEAAVGALCYADSSNQISVPMSHQKGRLTGKVTIGKKVIAPDPNLFRYAHFHVVQQMSIAIPGFANKTTYSSHVCSGSFIPHTRTYSVHR
jgi:hypothetical protein